jgi:predicted metal-dependent enzyme (double-stranded beta helix superfamily)
MSKSETLLAPSSGLTLQKSIPFLERLVGNRAFLESRILPHLEQGEQTERWYVAERQDAQDDSYSLQVFVWPPGSRTRIHDHASWGALCCAAGSVLEERYERLDDGSQQGCAQLKKAWQRVWERQDGVSTVLPLERGIHRIGNPGDSVAISVHLYGPRATELDGRDYDPSRDYVCDRRDADESGSEHSILLAK